MMLRVWPISGLHGRELCHVCDVSLLDLHVYTSASLRAWKTFMTMKKLRMGPSYTGCHAYHGHSASEDASNGNEISGREGDI